MPPRRSYRISFFFRARRRPDAPTTLTTPALLPSLVEQLQRFHSGDSDIASLRQWMLPLLAADPLDVSRSDATSWHVAPNETRLFWRLVYLFDTGTDPEAELRALAGRVVRALASTGDAALTHELLPILLDQQRLCTIVERHARGVISRTGWLSVVAESGYPPHAKLWLEHAGPEARERLCGLLRAGAYAEAAGMMERAP